MTLTGIRQGIRNIRNAVADRDGETAYTEENVLYAVFIEYVAERNDLLGKKARLVLSTKDLDFERYTA